MIMDDHSTNNAGNVTFSQPHGANYGDIDGDGITDFSSANGTGRTGITIMTPTPMVLRSSIGTGRFAIQKLREEQSSSRS